MNLARHAAAVWRFRGVALGGVALGLILALLASFKIGPDGIAERGSETWTATSSILVTQPGFPEGRVTLPTAQVQDAVSAGGAAVKQAQPKDAVQFADPGRLSALADLYAKFFTGDDVAARVKEKPAGGTIEASPFLASAGGQVLPVIQLETTGPSQAAAKAYNESLFESLRTTIQEQQQANRIGSGQRIEIKFLDAPESVLTGARKHTAAILLFALCLVGTVAVTHLLEGLRPRPAKLPADDLDGWNATDVAMPDGFGLEPGSLEYSGRRSQ